MARFFNDAASQYLELDSAPLTAVPLTMGCWFNSNDITVLQTLMSIVDKDVNDERVALLMARGDVGGDPIHANSRTTGTNVNASSSTGFSTNTWHHACGVWASASSRAAYIDGGSKGTETTSVVAQNQDRISIGRYGGSSPGFEMSGSLAEAAIWNVALSDAEVALWAKGFSPLFIQPHNLVAYWPLIRDADNDWIGGFDLTAFNTPTIATHPPLVVHPMLSA